MNKAKIITCMLVVIFIQTITASAISSDVNINIESEYDLIVDDDGTADYANIQDAICVASEGDSVFVKEGYYQENIVICKSIELIGEDKYNTIIDGGIKTTLFKKESVVITAEADNIKISNFTIQNATGINGRGIYFIKNKGRDPSENNTITNNIIINCSYGLMVVNAKNNNISNNSFYGCSGGSYSPNLPYYDNVFSDNTVNDKPVLDLINKENMIIEGDYGVIYLTDCRNITIRNFSTSHVTVGIALGFCEDIKVTNCTITNTNRGGVSVHSSNNCKFTKNTLENDNWGIFLRGSDNNQIKNNNFLNITKYDWFASSHKNVWDGNFWGKPMSRPKLFYGKMGFREKIHWFNIDWNPATELN